MIECPFCHTSHVDNTLFCDECGTYLIEDDKQETDPLIVEAISEGGFSPGDLDALQVQSGTGPLVIRLKIEDGLREVEVPLDKAIHLGRLDPASDTFPEIDLSDVGGLHKGVSRRHARIIKREGTLVIEDLGSINGTFVNGQKLAPYLAEIIEDGDKVHLGTLLLEVEL